MKILHAVNSFDPAEDVVRCVRELNKYSKHEHRLFVKDPHPLQKMYKFDEPDVPGWKMTREQVLEMFDWADFVMHQFVGRESGWMDPSKPSSFRNVNIYWNQPFNRFWTLAQYNASTYDGYQLLASSHVGAMDFMPHERFRWLPDLMPLDGEYEADFSEREHCVSFIKHFDKLRHVDFKVPQLDLHDTAHHEVLTKRRTLATVAVDNVCDGHWGCAGQESTIMGIPTVAYLHRSTMKALEEIAPSPFVGCVPDVSDAVKCVREVLRLSPEAFASLRKETRAKAVKCFDPRMLVERFWDPFFDESMQRYQSVVTAGA